LGDEFELSSRIKRRVGKRGQKKDSCWICIGGEKRNYHQRKTFGVKNAEEKEKREQNRTKGRNERI